MKLIIGGIVAFAVGAGCRFFDIPVPSPPVLPGALLVVVMTLGYTITDRAMSRTTRAATTKHLCGGPTGETIAASSGRAVSATGLARGTRSWLAERK
jgi:XapX domain-containing protein